MSRAVNENDPRVQPSPEVVLPSSRFSSVEPYDLLGKGRALRHYILIPLGIAWLPNGI